MKLKDKVKNLPLEPGVYIMKDSLGNIIYIGKSKCLKKRVGQYFQNINKHVPKIQRMIKNIYDFEYMITDTELDALLLECRFIKEIKPRYNSLLKNDKNYNYIKIDIKNKYPDITMQKQRLDENSLYFGPYTKQRYVEDSIDFLKKHFGLRQCSISKDPLKNSQCLNYSLGYCRGVCTGEITESEYAENIGKVIDFLEGKDKLLIKDVEKIMYEYSADLNFGEAAKYRDYLFALNHLMYRQKVIGLSVRKRNIIAVEKLNYGQYKVFIFCGNEMEFSQIIDPLAMDMAQQCDFILYNMINSLSTKIKGRGRELKNSDIDEAQIIYSYLKNNCLIKHAAIPETWIAKRNDKKIVDKIIKLIV